MAFRQRAVGARLPVLPAGPGRTGQHLLSQRGEGDLRVLGHRAGGAVDFADHLLRDGGRRPQELARFAVEGVDDTGLARHAGDDLADLAGLDARVDPAHGVGVRRDGGVDEHPLERVVEVPVVVQVLIVTKYVELIYIIGLVALGRLCFPRWIPHSGRESAGLRKPSADGLSSLPAGQMRGTRRKPCARTDTQRVHEGIPTPIARRCPASIARHLFRA